MNTNRLTAIATAGFGLAFAASGVHKIARALVLAPGVSGTLLAAAEIVSGFVILSHVMRKVEADVETGR